MNVKQLLQMLCECENTRYRWQHAMSGCQWWANINVFKPTSIITVGPPINDDCTSPHQWWLYETTSMIPVMTVIMSWHQWSISLRQAAAARLSVRTARPVPPAHTTEHTAGSSWPTGWGCTRPRLRSSPAAAGWCRWPWHPLLVWRLPVLSSLSLWPPADHTQAIAAVEREIWQISL